MNSQPRSNLLHQLRAQGIRLTPQRACLVQILETHDGFADVATLCSIAKQKGARVDRATVYRTLALLRAHQLLAGPANGLGRRREGYEGTPISQDELGLICEQCGTRQAIAAGAPECVRRELLRCTGFDARAIRLEARGACRLCAARARIRSRQKDKLSSSPFAGDNAFGSRPIPNEKRNT
jgi:Fe2+ or Zn2+ uptake regulation protein